MKRTPHKTERIHSLDSLRAIMMLLGLVLHSALTYNVTFHGDAWELKDPFSTNVFTDSVVFFIHSFRMPIFFLVAGFFGALLFYERKPIKMIKNRISRITFPFVVFLFILWPIILITFSYTNAVFSRNENPLTIALVTFSSLASFLPKTTFHLWFLYYLMHTTFTTVLLALLLKKSANITSHITKSFNWIIQRPFVRILFFSGVTFLVYLFLETTMIEASVSLIPDLNTFVFYFFSYLVGWVFFKSKHLLSTLMSYDWLSVILAVLLTVFQGLVTQDASSEVIVLNSKSEGIMILGAITVWLFIFGITGLFIRYGSDHSIKMRYISDASYWVYLIHLPITAIIPAFIYEWQLHAVIKFLIVLIVTTFICFATYHYFVRNTFIGKFLNGKKYPVKINKFRAKELKFVKTNKL